MFKVILVILVVLIGAVLVYAATRPDTLRVQRSTIVQAPPDKIFAFVNDLHRWSVWSPYEKKDPAMKRTHSGAASGKGAVYEWDGNKDVGAGRMEIIDVSAPNRITIKLDFLKPFEGHNTAVFTFEPTGESTNVTWAMEGPSPFMTKLIGVFLNMDEMIGTDFAAGLATLKSVAEA